MRPVAVVMVDDDLKHPLEMAAVEDQQSVEAFGADGADEAFCDGVRLRRSHRRADDLDPFASEHAVEVARELAVAIVDEEANRCRSLAERPGELAGLLANPAAASTVKKSTASMLCACARRNSRQERPARSAAGPRPAALRIARTVVAETVTPRPRSSPTIRW